MIGARSHLPPAAFALLIVAGCNTSAAPPPPPGSQVGNGSVNRVPAPPPPSPPDTVPLESRRIIMLDDPNLELPKQESFVLLGAGTGKRVALRYTLAAGSAAVIAQTTLSQRHLAGSGGFTQPAAMPAIRDGFVVTTTAAEPRQLTLRALPAEVAAPSPDADAYLASWRALLQDRQITVTVDARGMFTTIAFPDDPAAARNQRSKDELVERLASTIVPLPVEPVGPGASWKVVTILRQARAYAKQTATYTLVSATPASWKVHVKLQRVGEQQFINDPSLPSGVTAELLAMVRQLEGDVGLDPQHPLITGGSLAIESRLHVKLTEPKQPPTELIFEDTGSVAFARCRSAASGPAAHRFGDCPDGFAPWLMGELSRAGTRR